MAQAWMDRQMTYRWKRCRVLQSICALFSAVLVYQTRDQKTWVGRARNLTLLTTQPGCHAGSSAVVLRRSAIYEAANKAAEDESKDLLKYLKEIEDKMEAFLSSGKLVNRGETVKQLLDAMESKSTTLVLGGRNLGKTFLLNKAIDSARENGRAVLHVDLRDPRQCRKSLEESLLIEARSVLRKGVETRFFFFKPIIQLVTTVDAWRRSLPAPEAVLRKGVKEALAEAALNALDELLGLAAVGKTFPTIVIDEAHLELPGDQGKANRLLQIFAKWTKGPLKRSIVLVTPEFSYPYDLDAAGFALSYINRVILVPEVPDKFMLDFFKEVGMSDDLAQAFLEVYGGDIYTSVQALETFRLNVLNGAIFNPMTVIDCPGLGICAENAASRPHLQAIVDQGYSVVKNIGNEGAKLVAKEDVGAIVNVKFAMGVLQSLPAGFDESEYVLVPSTSYMRKVIAYKLARTPLP